MSDEPARVRAFLAVPLPEVVRSCLREALAALASIHGVRWVPPENLHLTLKFLGDVEEKKLAGMEEDLRELANTHLPFVIGLGEGGVFPSWRRPRTIWIGLSRGEKELNALAQGIEAVCRRWGFPTEARPFHGHVTLGRVKEARAARSLKQRLEAALPATSDVWTAGEFQLLRSDLTPSGARYTPMATISLRRSPSREGERP